jgi:MFS superfamily sulfate permease-like transporter
MQSNGYSDFRFNLEEIAGAVGDYGTLIPIVLGVAIASKVNIGYMLLFFSIWYIITGLYYKMPVPVEPMKAVGAIVIAGSITAPQIAASGIIIGILFLLLGVFRGMRFIENVVPLSVIRGIQLGLALILLKTSIRFITDDYTLAGISIAIIVAFFLLSKLKNIPDISALVVLLLGVVIGLLKFGCPAIQILPLPKILIPGINDFLTGTWSLAVPQIPLTITNAILATALLMNDLLKRDLDTNKLSATIGLMNLTAAPFGGFPMCHGAGGLAAQYRFGARTGGSNIISGIILLPVALFFADPEWIAIFPVSIFGALLVFIAFELGKHGVKTDEYAVTFTIAIVSLLINITTGFIAGMAFYYLLRRIRKNNINGD